MMRLPLRRSALPLMGALMFASCATTGPDGTVEPDYASDAEANLQRGNEALGSDNFVEAEKYFEHVRSKYPFLDAAKTATLRLADVNFERERYLEARDRYRSFIKQYPSHPMVDYAAFRAAMTHYKDIPSDFFLLPPSRQKDQADVRNTLTAMTDFIRQYPNSSYVGEAKSLIDETRRRLAEHELSIAHFYSRRGKWPAVIGRLRTLVTQYPGVGLDEEAYWGIYEAHQKLNELEQAKAVLEEIQQKLPGTPAAERARDLLGQG